MADETGLHLEVMVNLGGDIIAGTVQSRAGSRVDFTGWLEFMSAVDNLAAQEAKGPSEEPT